MVAPEAIGPLHRYAALVAEVPVIRLAEPLARELGLREGQIIQASLEIRPEGTALRLGDRLLMLPAGWQRVAAGDMRWFQVIRQSGGVGLKLTASPAASAAAQPGASALVAPNMGAAATSGVVSTNALGSGIVAPSSGARLSALLGRSSGFDSLFNVLKPGALETMLQGQADGARLSAAVAALRLRVDHLSSQAVQHALMMSGLWSEAIMGAGRSLPGQDLKSLLRQTLRLLGAGSSTAREVESAIDDVERAQIDAAQAQADQRQVFTMLLPFADAEPAWVRFEREPRRPGQAAQRYVIDLHLKPPVLGDLWIKTGVTGLDVDLTVWTARPEIAKLVEKFRDELTFELEDAGLRLQGMQIIEAPRPQSAPTLQTAPERTPLDLRV